MFYQPSQLVVAFASKFDVNKSVTQSITGFTPTKVEFNVKEYDGLSEFDNITNFRFTASEAGYYHFASGVSVDSLNDGNTIQGQIIKNGTIIVLLDTDRMGAEGTGHAQPTGDLHLDEGDTIEYQIYHTAGTAKNTGIGYNCHFSGHRFG